MKNRIVTIGIVILTIVLAGCFNPAGDGSPDSGPDPWQPPQHTWRFIDGAGTFGLNVGLTANAYRPSSAILGGDLYVGWTESSAPDGDQVRVALYNGNNESPSFQQLDSGGWNQDAPADAKSLHLRVFDGKLYGFWHEFNAIRGAVYNGNAAAPDQTSVTGVGINAELRGSTEGIISSAVLNDTLYLLYEEADTDPTPSEYRMRVVRYNGNDSSPEWFQADAGGLNDVDRQQVDTPSLVAHNGKLYAFWGEQSTEVGNNNYFLQAAVYNGNDLAPAWTPIDGGSIEPAPQANPESNLATAVSFQNRLYLFWVGGDNYKVRAAVYNDDDTTPQWSDIDGGPSTGLNYDSSQSAYSLIDTVVAGSTLYVTWSEEKPSSVLQLRVAAFNGDPSDPEWAFVDGGGPDGLNLDPNSYDARHPSLSTTDGENLYLLWQEQSGASQTRIRARVGERTN